MDPTWQHPFTCVIARPTGCGKTEWVMNFVHHLSDMVDPVPQKVVWAYGEWQNRYLSLPDHVQFIEGIPHLDIGQGEPMLMVIDDQMYEVDRSVSNLFTRGSHHRNISIIYIVQNLFDKHKEHRTISLNTHYIVKFKDPRDSSQIICLGKQMYPGKTHFIRDAYDKATKEPYGYLLIDLKQNTPDQCRLRSHIFPGELQVVYIPE